MIFGGLGQDDILGGSSDFFSLVTPDLRPDGLQSPALNYQPGHDRGADILFGGAGSRIGINDETSGGTNASTPGTGGTLAGGTVPADMDARDADTIVGDNGRIIRIVGINRQDGIAGIGTGQTTAAQAQSNYVTFQYDQNTGAQRLVVRGVTLLDYTLGGPDFLPENFGLGLGADCTNGSPTQPICSNVLSTDLGAWRNTGFPAAGGGLTPWQTGGRDEVHGETGDDTVYGGADHDVIYGDAQSDDLIGGWGNDWISGGTGQDGILGDDGRIFTSRNGSTGITLAGVACNGNTAVPGAAGACYSERLFGITALLAIDPDTKYSNGNVLNEFIYTPGQGQAATINLAGALNKAADLTIYNLGPDVNAGNQHVANSPLYDANNSDDIIFGGWGSDWIHGGAGDDAISGAEAIGTDPDDNRAAPNGTNGPLTAASGYTQHFDALGNLVGLEYIDFAHPYNPGDVLHFGADTNPWHANNHNEMRLGEFLLYDEYDPRRAILFNGGQTWGCTSWSPSGHTCTGSSDRAQFGHQFFLNNEDRFGDILLKVCVAVDNQGNCLAWKYDQASDGDDAIFGDLGNDWLVGGTGMDTLWGGWGNDLHQADDDLHSGCLLMANNGTCTTYGDTWLNDIADGVNSSFQDRAYGGAGLDILIGNTAGDRLIDWVGEFNSYLVPFAPFGMATVSRQNNPGLPEFLYALSRSQGADPTRWSDEGSDPLRNGEPFGELGLIRQEDHGYWQTQTGGPTDPQAGNIPGGKRDSVRGADFNDGTLQGFLTDSGTFAITQGVLAVTAASSQGDAVAVWYSDAYQTVYYEVSARISMDKPTGGWKANAYIIFDYFSPTDFKFAGIDQSTNKMVIGERTATGWWVRAQGSVPGGVKANTFYNLNVVINGLVVTVTADGKNAFSFTFAPRIIGGQQVALNRGMTGFGSNQAKGLFDNINLTVIAPEITIDRTEFFEGGGPTARQDVTGTWSVVGGRLQGTTNAAGTATTLLGIPVGGTAYANVEQFEATSYLQVTATLRAAGITGILFDWYSVTDYKFVGIDVGGQRVVIGHVAKGVRTIDLAIARALAAGTDYVLDIVPEGDRGHRQPGGSGARVVRVQLAARRRQAGAVRPRYGGHGIRGRLSPPHRRRALPRIGAGRAGRAHLGRDSRRGRCRYDEDRDADRDARSGRVGTVGRLERRHAHRQRRDVGRGRHRRDLGHRVVRRRRDDRHHHLHRRRRRDEGVRRSIHRDAQARARGESRRCAGAGHDQDRRRITLIRRRLRRVGFALPPTNSTRRFTPCRAQAGPHRAGAAAQRAAGAGSRTTSGVSRLRREACASRSSPPSSERNTSHRRSRSAPRASRATTFRRSPGRSTDAAGRACRLSHHAGGGSPQPFIAIVTRLGPSST